MDTVDSSNIDWVWTYLGGPSYVIDNDDKKKKYSELKIMYDATSHIICYVHIISKWPKVLDDAS